MPAPGGVHLRREPVAVALVGAVGAQLLDELGGAGEVAVLDEQRRQVFPRPPPVGVTRPHASGPVEVAEGAVVVAEGAPHPGALDERRDEVVAADAAVRQLVEGRVGAGQAAQQLLTLVIPAPVLDHRPQRDHVAAGPQADEFAAGRQRFEAVLEGPDVVGPVGSVEARLAARARAVAPATHLDGDRVGLPHHAFGQSEQLGERRDVDPQPLTGLDGEHPRRVGHARGGVAGRGRVTVP